MLRYFFHHGFDLTDEQGRRNRQALIVWLLCLPLLEMHWALWQGVPGTMILGVIKFTAAGCSARVFIDVIGRMEPAKHKVPSPYSVRTKWKNLSNPLVRVL